MLEPTDLSRLRYAEIALHVAQEQLLRAAEHLLLCMACEATDDLHELASELQVDAGDLQERVRRARHAVSLRQLQETHS